MTLRWHFAAVLLAALCAAPAQAVVLGAGDTLRWFNAVTAGGFSTDHDVEGPIVVGGTLDGRGSLLGLGLPLPAAFAQYGSASVYGATAGARFNANRLNVTVATADQGGRFSGAAAVRYAASNLYALSDIMTPLYTLSVSLAALADTGTVFSGDTNAMVITAKPAVVSGVANIAVVTLSAATLASYRGLQIAPNGASTVIINVRGNLSSTVNLLNAASWGSSVLWNFSNATSVTLGTAWAGTVLAPMAAVTNTAPLDGGLVAASFIGQAELHYVPTSGSVTLLNTLGSAMVVVPTATPEPASALLYGAALASLLLACKRMRRVTALREARASRAGVSRYLSQYQPRLRLGTRWPNSDHGPGAGGRGVRVTLCV